MPRRQLAYASACRIDIFRTSEHPSLMRDSFALSRRILELLCFVLVVLASPFKSKARLEAENAVLRHQLIVLRRRLHRRVRLTNHDRWFFIQLYRWFQSILQVLTMSVRRSSSLASGWLSALLALEIASTERAPTSRDGTAHANPADQRRKSALGSTAYSWRTAEVGFEVAQSSVAKYMVKRRRPPSQGWRTFLRNHAQG